MKSETNASRTETRGTCRPVGRTPASHRLRRVPACGRLRRTVGTAWLVALTAAAALSVQPPPGADLARLESEAETLYATGDLEAAVAIYHQLGERRSDPAARAEALVTAAWLEHRLGYDDLAETTLGQALALESDYLFEPANFDRSFVELYGRAAEARAAELRSRTAADVERGVEALEAGSTDVARDAFERALTIDPDDPRTLYYLGVAELAAGEVETATSRLRQVANWEPPAGHSDIPADLRLAALAALAQLDLEAGRDEAAIAGFQKVLALMHGIDPEAGGQERRLAAHSGLGYLHFRQQLFEDAEQHLEAAIELDPERASDWHNLALTRQALGRQEGAVEAFRRAVDLDPADPALVRGLASALRDAGDWAEAADLLAEMVATQPDEPQLWMDLGVARRRLGDGPGAIEALSEVVRLDAANRAGLAAPAASQLAFLHLQGSEPARAAELARRATELDASSVDAWLYLCIAQQRLEEPAAALESCRRARELDPARADLSSQLGIVHARLRDYRAAEEAFRHALSLDPDLQAARGGLETLRGNLERRALDLGLVLAEDGSPPDGARVASVEPRTMAAAARLESGDVIRRVDGREIASADDLLYFLAALESPGTADLEVVRGGRSKRLRLRY